MRITIEIPDELLNEAMALTGTKNRNQLMKDALISQVNLIKRQKLISFKGKVDLDIDLDTLRDR
ncbi:MAG: type II toxin-antitoxin system VapB family antitoxin [Cyclobacteriaceae bacterium]